MWWESLDERNFERRIDVYVTCLESFVYNSWYNTPNLHMCTIKDLFNYCDEKNIKIQKVFGVNKDKISMIKKSNLEIKNFFSKLGIFLIG